ncbi:MAG: hypothetical protein RIT45_1087 [Pseudomonadota bacterium]|jgi:uracil-DNA glycosylase
MTAIAGPATGSAENRPLRLHPSWKARLSDIFETPEMVALRAFLLEEKRRGQVVYPPGAEIFAALDHTPFERVRVVILGQDPYHGPGQAHGLSFSVRRGVPMPPSLQNIFKELGADLGVPMPRHGELLSWADQGVLLLNASLTVRAHQAGSHADKGWHGFTDRVLQELDQGREGLCFLLWGSHAQRKAGFIDRRRHLVLRAPHPSPLSAHRGFFGCGHFSRVNAWLQERGDAPIDWALGD